MTFKKRILSIALGLNLAVFGTAFGENVDQILMNGKIYTAVEGEEIQEAIALYQDRIVKVGTNLEIQNLATADTKIIDLKNQFVMPGLIDSHTHPLAGGIESVTANMHDEYVDIDTLEQRLIAFRNEGTAKAGDTLVVNGMSSEQWSNLEDLNTRFNQGEWQEIPIALVGSDHHTSWANDKLLQRAGVTAAYVQALSKEDRQYIGHDDHYQPNGFLVDAAWGLVSESIPKLDDALVYQGALTAVKMMNREGITAWLDVATNTLPNQGIFNITNTPEMLGMLPVYEQLSENNDLTMHVAGLQVINSKSRPEVLEVIEDIGKKYAHVENLKMVGVKVFVDGVIEYPAQSAALLGEYRNNQSQGELLIDPKSFSQLVNLADQKGIVVHTHAIGDKAVQESLNAFEYARSQRNSDVPHTITHVQIVAPEDYTRFEELNVIASMQLLWAYPDDYIAEMVKPYISEDNYRGMYPAASLVKAGATIAGASDYPVSTANPFMAMSIAMTRQEGSDGDVLNSEEALDLNSLLKIYTIHAAKALNWDQEIGSLEAGKKADLILLDRNILNESPESIAETEVLWTMFEGKIVYEKTDSQKDDL